jgi:hypothetical protein
MKNLTDQELKKYIQAEVRKIHDQRLNKFDDLRNLDSLLKRKNPYLFKTKNLQTSEEFVKALLDASLSSSEETALGNFLERLAIFISQKEFGGKKSISPGIDLEFDREGTRYIVTIKSGPNWANSGQRKQMEINFQSALKVVRTSGSKVHAECVEGCCYGQEYKEEGIYRKICGQQFWEFVSGEPNLYKEIIDPLGAEAKERNEAFQKRYVQAVNKFAPEFSGLFVREGAIDWEKLIEFNSGPDVKYPRVATLQKTSRRTSLDTPNNQSNRINA